MARRNQYKPKKPSNSGRSQYGRSKKDRQGVPVGRWVLLVLILLVGYHFLGPKGSTPDDQDLTNVAQASTSDITQGLSPQKQTSATKKSKPSNAGKISSKDSVSEELNPLQLWRVKKIHLGQGFVVEKYIVPNEAQNWEAIFNSNDSNSFFVDTLSSFFGEVWAKGRSGEKAVLRLLRNSRGELRYWDWTTGDYFQSWFNEDSSWIDDQGCSRGLFCPLPPLKDYKVSYGEGLYKNEIWRSDSSMNVIAPIHGFVSKYDEVDKRGRVLQIENNAGEVLTLEGLGNLAHGLKIGSKVHQGMKIGTLLYQKAPLKVNYTKFGISHYLSQFLAKDRDLNELEARKKTISELLSRG